MSSRTIPQDGVAIPRTFRPRGKEEKHTGVIEKEKMLEYVLSL